MEVISPGNNSACALPIRETGRGKRKRENREEELEGENAGAKKSEQKLRVVRKLESF